MGTIEQCIEEYEEEGKEDKRKRSLVERGAIPAYGQEVSYVMEDGESVSGKVIGVDSYENHVIVTVKRKDGSLYGAILKRRKA